MCHSGQKDFKQQDGDEVMSLDLEQSVQFVPVVVLYEVMLSAFHFWYVRYICA